MSMSRCIYPETNWPFVHFDGDMYRKELQSSVGRLNKQLLAEVVRCSLFRAICSVSYNPSSDLISMCMTPTLNLGFVY